MFDFQPRQARVRRAWERLPTSPLAPGRKGRKVWKRPQPTSAIESSEVTSLRNEAAGNRGHSIKRLRTTRVSTVPARGAGRRNQQFVAMLQDQAPGTPKSAQVPTTPVLPCHLSIAFLAGKRDFWEGESSRS